jgi:hypothetical protein
MGTEHFFSRRTYVKYALLAMVAMCGLMLGVTLRASDANALSCRRTAYGSGCVGPHGGAAVNRHGAVIVSRHGVYTYHRGSKCYWRNNHRICP